MRETAFAVALFVVVIVALAVTAAVVATQMSQKPTPPQPATGPEVAGWYYTGKDMAWPTQTFYRYAYVDLVQQTQSPWSASSEAVLSMGAAMPVMQVVPTGTTVIVWQRKLLGGHWQAASMVAVKAGAVVSFDQNALGAASALTTQERVHSANWIDMANPGSTQPGRPRYAPFPSTVGAQEIDARGLTWAREGTWPLPTRFACRFVAAEPGPWSAWSESLWASDHLSDPVMQLPWTDDAAVQLSGSWFYVGLATSAVHLVFHKENDVRSAVSVALALGRTTIDAVLLSIEQACFQEAGAPVRLTFSLELGQVAFELLRGEPTPDLPAVSSFTMLVNGPDSAFRALGFTEDICCGLPGKVYLATSAPALAFEPVVADSAVMVVA